jgi:hypothetical protein
LIDEIVEPLAPPAIVLKHLEDDLLTASGAKKLTKKRPKLTKEHAKLRLEWAKNHKYWTYTEWSKVIWSDESSIELGKGQQQLWVFHLNQLGEKWKKEYIKPYPKG